MEVLNEWLTEESIAYAAECLEWCNCPEMVSDLRSLFPKEALTIAARRLSPEQKQRIRQWVTVSIDTSDRGVG